MGTLDLIVAGTCGVVAHAMLQLWRNRDAPGAVPSLLLLVAVTSYAVTVVHQQLPMAVLQIGYLSVNLVAPLLFTAAIEYTGLAVPGWKILRWLLVPAVALLAAVNIVTDQVVSTRWISYTFALLTILASLRRLAAAPAQGREMLVLVIVTSLVVAVDVGHYFTGFTVAGIPPTPFAMAIGLLAATSLLYGANAFDLRLVARAKLIESVVDGMLVIDAGRRIVDCNAAAGRIVGKSRKELIGAPAGALLPREFTAMFQSPTHLRCELAVRTGPDPVWFEVDVTPLDLRGRAAGHLLVARNIGERRRAQEDLEHSRNALMAANARLVEQSITDPLTGLKNRRFLFQRLNEEMNRHHRAGSVLGLLVVDIDHFKTVNDTHGHPVGDEALIQVSGTLASQVRDCDVVARLGGEEFAVLAVNSDGAGLIAMAERIREAIRQVPVARNTYRPMVLTVSVGVAFAGPDTRTADGLFADADRHLYMAKHQGRNRVIAARAPTGEAGAETAAEAAADADVDRLGRQPADR